MNTWKVVAITLGVILVIFLGSAYGFLASQGLSARKKPSNFEYSIANTALGVSMPSDAKKKKNPLNITPDDLIEAKKHYKEHCEVCHAENGNGQVETSEGMSPEVPDLRAEHIQKLTDGELFYIVKNGVRFTGMPAWDMPDDQIWRLVAFLRQLPKQFPPVKPAH
jgi:Cytochrome C oxidase, cbb3-type, subunit III